MSTAETTLLSGWGRTAPSRAVLEAPRDLEQLLAALGRGGPLIARGLGRSYGDPAQCAGGRVLDLSGFDSISEVSDRGEVRVGAGVSLHRLLCEVLPKGWFLPVTPGTRQVSIGGALSADVHGKNHHRDGAFGAHVSAFEIVTPRMGVLEVTPESDPPLFWATIGGMGLTGVLTQATLRLLPIETDTVLVDTERFADLDSLMSAMREGDARYRYSVAWVDCTRRAHGRGVLTRGDHASSEDLASLGVRRALRAPSPPLVSVPMVAPSGLLNPVTIAAFNEAWFRRAPAKRDREPQSIPSFFHPLDGIGHWNLLYGRRGFLQYQFVVADRHDEVVRSAIDLLGKEKIPSFLAVLKRFGEGDDGMLSFPMKGWTFAVDMPVGSQRLSDSLDTLDQMVLEATGRVYLAKDARLAPERFAAMYLRLEEFRAVRRRVDPDGVLASDQSRRLRITTP